MGYFNVNTISTRISPSSDNHHLQNQLFLHFGIHNVGYFNKVKDLSDESYFDYFIHCF